MGESPCPRPRVSSSAFRASSLVTSSGNVRASATRTPPSDEEPSARCASVSSSSSGGGGGEDRGVVNLIHRRVFTGVSAPLQEVVVVGVVERVVMFCYFFGGSRKAIW